MVQEHAWIIIKINQDSYSLTGHEQDGVFPAFIHIAPMRDSASLNDSKLLTMQVDGMGLKGAWAGHIKKNKNLLDRRRRTN